MIVLMVIQDTVAELEQEKNLPLPRDKSWKPYFAVEK
jgi:hypothetical protein